MSIILSLIITLMTSLEASASCAQIFSPIDYVCKIDDREARVVIPEQEVCGASYQGRIDGIPVKIMAGPMLDSEGTIGFEISTNKDTSEMIGPCIESRGEIY